MNVRTLLLGTMWNTASWWYTVSFVHARKVSLRRSDRLPTSGTPSQGVEPTRLSGVLTAYLQVAQSRCAVQPMSTR